MNSAPALAWVPKPGTSVIDDAIPDSLGQQSLSSPASRSSASALGSGRVKPNTAPRITETETASMATEIVVVDDQELMRLSFRMVIDSQPDLTVTGEAGDGAEAITAARALRPDVMLMDLRMPDLDGLQAARQIIREAPEARIILMTTFHIGDYVEAGLRAGVRGFLPKGSTPVQLLTAIRAVVAGAFVLPARAPRDA